MLARFLLAATLVAGLSIHALAQSQGVRSMLVDERGNAINATNPLPTSGGGGGGGGGGGTVTQGTSPWVISGTSAANGSGNPIFVQVTNPGTTGTVTAAGTNGSVAQAVQGITGGVPLPVSGTFWQATQPVSNAGTFAVQNTAAVVGGNATAVKTDGSATTQPVSGTVSALNLGIYNSTAPTVANGAQTILQATANGSLFVDASRSTSQPLPTGAATETTLASLKGATDNAITTYTVTATGTQTGVQTTGYGSVLVEMTGTFTGVIAQVEASTNTTNGIDGTWTALAGINPEDTVNPPTTTLLSGAAFRRKLYRAQDGVWIRLNTTSYGTGTAVVNLVRRTAPIAERISYVSNTVNAVENASANAGGLTTVSRIVSSAASTNATSAKAAPGRLYKITGFNAASSIRWLKFYNIAAAPTPGTTTVFFQLPLPPGAFSFDAQDLGYYFSTGVAYALTTGAADADTGALTAADILNLNVWYQ